MSTIIKNYSESKFKSTFSSLDHATRMQRSQYLQSVNNFQQNEINRLERVNVSNISSYMPFLLRE